MMIIVTKLFQEPTHCLGFLCLKKKDKGRCKDCFGTDMLIKESVLTNALFSVNHRKKPHPVIGMHQNFRPVNSITDVDILPETHQRISSFLQTQH